MCVIHNHYCRYFAVELSKQDNIEDIEPFLDELSAWETLSTSNWPLNGDTTTPEVEKSLELICVLMYAFCGAIIPKFVHNILCAHFEEWAGQDTCPFSWATLVNEKDWQQIRGVYRKWADWGSKNVQTFTAWDAENSCNVEHDGMKLLKVKTAKAQKELIRAAADPFAQLMHNSDTRASLTQQLEDYRKDLLGHDHLGIDTSLLGEPGMGSAEIMKSRKDYFRNLPLRELWKMKIGFKDEDRDFQSEYDFFARYVGQYLMRCGPGPSGYSLTHTCAHNMSAHCAAAMLPLLAVLRSCVVAEECMLSFAFGKKPKYMDMQTKRHIILSAFGCVLLTELCLCAPNSCCLQVACIAPTTRPEICDRGVHKAAQSCGKRCPRHILEEWE